MEELLSSIRTPYIHVSFDVDFMSSDYFTATGIPVPDGPTLEETNTCLSLLIGSGKVCSMDYVEYNPYEDIDGTGATLCRSQLLMVAEGLRNE